MVPLRSHPFYLYKKIIYLEQKRSNKEHINKTVLNNLQNKMLFN